MNFTVLDQYKSFVENNFIKKDTVQIDVLERIYDLWKMKDEKNFFFKNKFKTGVYLFGHVGSGKTFLLNIFCQHTKVGKKIHFNHLMNEIHNKINLNNNKNDNLEKYVKHLSKNKKIIFIDELHIFNIVDALIVKKLFTFFNKYKIFVLASSNFHPKDLYKDGLQRADFIPFIDLLIKNFEIINLTNSIDYRRLTLNQSKTYFVCNSSAKDKHNPAVAVCKKCEKTEELNPNIFSKLFNNIKTKEKYNFSNFEIEISTICQKCN